HIAFLEEGATPRPTGHGLSLGTATALEAAEDDAGFDVLAPDPAVYGSPDGVFVRTGEAGPEVSLAYDAAPGLPAADETGVGLLVTQFRARIDDIAYTKSIAFDQGTEIARVRVNGAEGFWIGGEPHVYARTETGELVESLTRLAGNTLIWEHGDVTLRLESGLGRRAALRVARSFR
ncbi:MAG: hypothetical protein M3273_09535, partial [Actinomycetota bacterium]|nr:hypothetical protein [Actinomycetota bacterium]